jgi:hypothetical protein
MKDRLYSTIIKHFPEEFFAVGERHEKVGAFFFEVKDRDTEGKNIAATFFVYESEPDIVAIEINNVMSKSKIEDASEEILKVLDSAIEIRERFFKISENRNKLIELEKKRQGSMEEKFSDKKDGKDNGKDDGTAVKPDEDPLHNQLRTEVDREHTEGNRDPIQDNSSGGIG